MAIMKRLILTIIGAGLLAGLGFYVTQHKTEVVLPAEPDGLAAHGPAGDEPKGIQPVAARLEQPVQSAEAPSVAKPISRPATALADPGLDASLLNQMVDVLVSKQASYQQKRQVWKQLRDAGQLDQAIAELERRTLNDPRTAEYPAALGQAYLKKCGVIQDVREQGILAMQADKLFDTALGLDPSNWEARFTKAVGMSYWPPMLNKSEEVIQHFQTLIQQQESQPPQPQFADTYAWLGEQYQKDGRSDDARTIWQRGATLFPTDEKLRTKLASTP
jgi:tetratricopeptide (TPR) repeat protein